MGQVLTHPLPLTKGQPFTFQDLADVYMSCYKGRSANQATCLVFFVGQLGHKIATEIDGDDVQDALDALARRGGVINRGGARAENKRITSSGKPLAPASSTVTGPFFKECSPGPRSGASCLATG